MVARKLLVIIMMLAVHSNVELSEWAVSKLYSSRNLAKVCNAMPTAECCAGEAMKCWGSVRIGLAINLQAEHSLRGTCTENNTLLQVLMVASGTNHTRQPCMQLDVNANGMQTTELPVFGPYPQFDDQVSQYR
jgi:hypothetical protein